VLRPIHDHLPPINNGNAVRPVIIGDWFAATVNVIWAVVVPPLPLATVTVTLNVPVTSGTHEMDGTVVAFHAVESALAAAHSYVIAGWIGCGDGEADKRVFCDFSAVQIKG